MKNKICTNELSRKQLTDAGMAFVFIGLILGLYTHYELYYKIAFGILLINMTFPKLLYPFAVVWFGFSQVMGIAISKLILTVIFAVIITPVGVVRRWMGNDPLQLRKFKKGSKSVMKFRDHVFTKEDLEQPY